MPDAVAHIEGRDVKLSNLDKVFYPEAGFTKAHVIEYYRQIAPVLLPHLQGRAVTLKRYPNGVEGPFFYEKRCPPHAPEWIRTQGVWSESRGEDIEYCLLDDLPSLVWAANLADLELHTFLARAQTPLAPTMIVFDLDPGPGCDVIDCCDVALLLRGVLSDLGLDSVVKVSGSKGMQLYVPLNTPATFEQTKPFARAIGEIVEQDRAKLVTTNMRKSEREGRVLVDWSQNDDHKTTVCVYSLRAKAWPTVSAPIQWKEVESGAKLRDAAALRFLPSDVHARVTELGDLFAPVLDLEQTLPVMR